MVYRDDKVAGATIDYVETYLAIKYGITLGHNYTSSDQTTLVYDITTYGNDIAGLGRDDCSGLDQRQSQSINNDAVVQVGQGGVFASNALNPNAIGADRSYVLWGNDDGVSCWSDADLVIATEPRQHIRIDREWKITETGPGGFSNLIVTLDTANANFDIPDLPSGATGYNLYVDDDGDFTSGATFATPMVLNGTSGKYEAQITPNGTTVYFTFGTRFDNPAPVIAYCPGDTVTFTGSHLASNTLCSRIVLSGSPSYTLTDTSTVGFQLLVNAPDLTNGNCLDVVLWVVPALTVINAGSYVPNPGTAPSPSCTPFTATNSIRQTSIGIGAPDSADVRFVGFPTSDSLYRCLGDVNPLITNFQGNPGVYSIDTNTSSISIGALLNDTTVMITSANIGEHKIIFTPIGSGCASYDSLWIKIDTLQPTTFEYGSSQVCETSGIYPITLPPVPSMGNFKTFPASTGPVIIHPDTGAFYPSVADTGTYVVVYTPPSDSGCYAKDTVLLRIEGVGSAQFTYPGSPYCTNDTNPIASIQYLPPGFTGGFRLMGNATGITIDPATGEIDLATATPGTYNIIYDLVGLCIDTPSVSVTILATPTLNFTLLDTVCTTRDTLSPTAVTNLNPHKWTEWTGNVSIDSMSGLINLDSSSIGGPFPITYHATSGNGCSDSITKPLVIIGVPTTSIIYPGFPGNNAFCQSDSDLVPIFQGGSGGGVYTSFPVTTALNATTGVFTPSMANAPGNYGISYSSPLVACPETTFLQNIQINQAPDASFTLAMDTVCEGGSNILISPTVALGNIGVYNGNTLVPNGITGGNSVNVAGIPAGITYGIRNEVFGAGSCRDTFVDFLSVLARQDAGFVYDPDTICDNGNDPTPLILGNGGGVFWADTTFNASTTVDASTGVIDLQASGNGTAIIYYATTGFCPDTSSFVVEILSGFDAFFTYEDNNICTTALVLNVDSVAAVGVFAPDTNSTGLVVDPTTGQINLTASNISGTKDYTVLHTVGQSGTCIDVHPVTVTIAAFDSLLSISFPQSTYCQSVDSIKAIIAGTGTPIGQFANSPGITFTNDSLGVIAVNQSGTGQYVIQFERDGFCAEVVTTNLLISPDDDSLFAYGNNGAICYSTSDSSLSPSLPPSSTGVYSATSGQASLNLVFADSITGEINVAASNPGVYQITYNSTGICPSSYTSTLRINDQPVVGGIDVQPGTSVCDSQDVDFSLIGTPGGTVFYYLNGILQTQSSVWAYNSFLEGDSVAVVVENTFGCADTASVIMTITTKPAVRIRQRPGVLTGSDPIEIEVGPNLDNTIINWFVTTGDSIAVDSSNGETLELDVDEFQTLTNNILLESDFIPDSIIYYFQAESRGCRGDLDSIIIYVNPNQFPIFVPEVFTPDGNGLNDTWKIQWSSDLIPTDYMIDVYNPSGGRVFQMIGLRDDWNGESLPDGVYWWVLKNQVTSETILAGGVTIRRR
jgi:gliding motility-associated-like protein